MRFSPAGTIRSGGRAPLPASAGMIDFGVRADEFSERHAEREPYLQRLALRGAPFPWPELDAALQRVEPTAPIVQLFNGEPLAEERST
ncbi:MAG TPA: hypothetical protein VNA66_04885, partial [Gammaproteobacteria bacterium]|nr:hypothetical protein [Gammaproteobacteria bacterium]